MDLLPKVFRTEGKIADFDPSKIFESILKETKMSELDAKEITELVVRRIISSGIKFLSGPHIREIVCSILSEQHFENERKLYTRIGMPLMDYEEILERKYSNDTHPQINPERLQHKAANQIAEEYAHLRILDNEESKAHLAGDIHINGLNYFVLRPFSQTWDPRIILEHGVPPIKNLSGYYNEKPPWDLKSAIYQLSLWLGMTQSEFYGIQGFNYVNTFIAPYIGNASSIEITQDVQRLLYQLNNLPLIIGREISRSLISLSPLIINGYTHIKAFKNTYGDYQKECIDLFIAFINGLEEAYQNNQLFLIPEYLLLLDEISVNSIEEGLSNFWESSNLLQKLQFSKYNERNEFLNDHKREEYLNYGTLQDISLNLPRYAFMSSKNEDSFLEILYSKLNLCSKILLKKYEIIKKRINSKQLPLCSSKIGQESLYNLEDQKLSVSLVGLNESIKYLSNYELHENAEAINLGKKILLNINRFYNEQSDNSINKFILSENKSNLAVERFQKLDVKEYPKEMKFVSKEQKYSNSVHFRENIDINILEKMDALGIFHKQIHEGAIAYFSLNEIQKNDFIIKDFIMKAIKESTLSSFKFRG
jgi:ribonucleoside-triphosphate reductase